MNLYKPFAALRGAFDSSVLFIERKLRAFRKTNTEDHLFSEQVQIPYIGSDLLIVGQTEDEVFLEKKSAGAFRLLLTTDLHLLSNAENDRRTIDLLLRNIAEIKPDLVILTGDIFTTDNPILDAIQFAQMMERVGVYWCWTFGNHECREEYSLFKYSLVACTAAYAHCLARVGKKELFGAGNYTVNLLHKNQLVKALFFLDSGRGILETFRISEGCPVDADGYDFLKKNQIDYYRERCAAYRAQYGTCSSFVCLHIPLCEYAEVFRAEGEGFAQSGNATVEFGAQREPVGSSPYNSGMFDAMREVGGEAVFAGHDHVNDFCADYRGVKLIYNQPSGYDEYHMGTKFGCDEADWIQGVTVVEVEPDGSFHVSAKLNKRFL